MRNRQQRKILFFHVFQNVLKCFYNNSPNAWMSTQNDENLREKYAPRRRGHRKNGFPKKSLLSRTSYRPISTELLWCQNRQNGRGPRISDSHTSLRHLAISALLPCIWILSSIGLPLTLCARRGSAALSPIQERDQKHHPGVLRVAVQDNCALQVLR